MHRNNLQDHVVQREACTWSRACTPAAGEVHHKQMIAEEEDDRTSLPLRHLHPRLVPVEEAARSRRRRKSREDGTEAVVAAPAAG